jgi:hypothetical protein
LRNFLQIAANVPVMPLLLAIHRQAKLGPVWREDTYLRDYAQGPFKDTESIILRFPDRSVHATDEALAAHMANFDQHENYDQPVFKLLPEARPLIFNLMAMAQGERLGRVMINKLVPGGRVFPHADTPVHAEYWDRFHIVLQSQPGSNFRAGDETVHMQTGDIWWFNNREEHEVVNNSAGERIHMVVDIRTSK